ncbi:MAG: FAD-binding oxidoreductase [Candidatus Bipolaricaulia bacterium]
MERLSQADLDGLNAIVGAKRMTTGASELDLHAGDESFHERHRPDVVIYPASTEEVSRILAWANERRVPVTAWGAGTSLEGNPIPIHGGIVLDMHRMDQIVNVWPEDLQVRVQAGVVFTDLNDRLRRYGLFFPPDPGASATIGGMIANNAGGIRAVKYGVTRDHALGLQVVLADGRIIETGSRSIKSSSGYDLTRLFVGSEGTLGVITEATLRLTGIPEEVMAAVVPFASVEDAARAVSEIIGTGLSPSALELVDEEIISLINRFKGLTLEERPTLLIEFHGSSRTGLEEEIDFAREICSANGATAFDTGIGREERDRLWEARYAVHEAIRHAFSQYASIVADVAVPISRFPEIVRYVKQVAHKTGIPGLAFGHAGDGNLHVELVADLQNEEEWRQTNRANDAIVEYALDLGGTATGEHGIGIGKRKFMAREHGESLKVMEQIKKTFDPNDILNPGKIF